VGAGKVRRRDHLDGVKVPAVAGPGRRRLRGRAGKRHQDGGYDECVLGPESRQGRRTVAEQNGEEEAIKDDNSGGTPAPSPRPAGSGTA
jgi:hypothetical protein